MFGRKIVKQSDLKKQAEYMATLVEARVTNQNELYRAVYSMVMQGMPLGTDSKMKEYIKQGYEGNPDAFSIITRLASMFASVPIAAYKIGSKRADRIEMTEEVDALFANVNYYQTMTEMRRHWATSLYVTGNAITYNPVYTSGINKGKFTDDGMIVMPTQNVIIESGGWRKPIGKYTLDIDQSYKIDPLDVWHERFAPSLDYEEGKNFMGMSPLKVARDIIMSQNKGYEITSKMYAMGHPPGILAKKREDGDSTTTAEQESKFREKYKTKYQGVNNMTVPIFTMGQLEYTKIGYDNLKELEVINMSQHGMRILCNVLQVPSQLFNDPAASTYNTMTEAGKQIYTARLIPDLNLFYDGLNRRMRAYGIELWPDLSAVDALQEDKAKRNEWASKMYNDGVITGDEYLKYMGAEPTGLPEMQIRYSGLNRIPITALSDDIIPIGESDKFYEQRNLNNVM